MKRGLLIISVLLSGILSLCAQIPTDGLVAYYPFNGNANDETGNGHNGTVYGATLTVDRFGNINSAYSFNGVNNRIFLSNSLLIEGNNISISCWFKVDDSGGKLISTGNRNSYNIGAVNESINSGLYLSDNDDGHGSGVTTNFDESYEWTHVVVTYDGTNHKLYRNGELVDNQIAEGSVFSNQAVYLNIGVYQYFGSNFSGWFSGSIDDVRLYNQTITQDEIQALYREGGFPTVTDIDGNIYKTINIGDQVWMAENLKTTTYNDGTPIPNVTENTVWSNLTTGAYCWYNNDEATYKDPYGALYNWFTVENNNLCPSGYHVPSLDEWKILEDFLIENGYNYDGTTVNNKIGKSLASNYSWKISSNVGAVGNNVSLNNSTGFSGWAGGRRAGDSNFYNIGENGYWWSTNKSGNTSYYRHLFYYSEMFGWGGVGDDGKTGISVRCLKNSDVIENKLTVENVTADENQFIEVPISVSNLTVSDNIISYQFDIDYDTTVLQYTGEDLTGTLAEGGTIDVNSGIQGKLSISYMNSTAMVGTGDILKIQFIALRADITTVTISNAYLNSTEVNDLANGTVIIRDVTPPAASISYGDTEHRCGDGLLITATFSEPMLESNTIKLNITGGASLSDADMTRVSETVYTYLFTVPNSSGDAAISLSNGTDLWGNEVIATPSAGETFSIIPINYGDVDDDSKILAYDAALTLQHSVGLDPLPILDPLPWENWRDTTANVDRITGITANDAGLILQYSTGKITEFSSTKKSLMQGFVSLQFLEDKIILISYGDLIGLNVSADNKGQILGEPIVLAENFMLAKNINGNTYRIGLCTSNSPADGTELLEIPILNSGQITLNMMVNNDIQSRQLNLVTDIKTRIADGLLVYPNPAKDHLFIEVSNEHIQNGYQLKIINQLGAVVNDQQVKKTSHKIDLADFAQTGLYYLQVIDSGGSIIDVRKIVIE